MSEHAHARKRLADQLVDLALQCGALGAVVVLFDFDGASAVSVTAQDAPDQFDEIASRALEAVRAVLLENDGAKVVVDTVSVREHTGAPLLTIDRTKGGAS